MIVLENLHFKFTCLIKDKFRHDDSLVLFDSTREDLDVDNFF